jgi:STE24 endopeptidase
MTAGNILALYLIVFFIYVAWESLLTVLNMRHVRRNAGGVPDFFRRHIDPDTYGRSVDYTLTKGNFGLFASLYSSALLLLFILSGFFGQLDGLVSSGGFGSYTHGVIFIYSLSLIVSVLNLPFGLYSTFVIEERFGFNKMSFGLWVKDQIKGLILSLLLMTPLLYGLFWFMDASGPLWWVYAFLFVSFFQLLLMYIYPAWIAPWFNKFSPLDEGQLREAIETLARRLEFKTAGIFLMDGSRRSAHGNAYFTGFGKNKRIVLFDTLINNLKDEQTVAVLAHEIGHQKKNHIKKSLAFSMLITLAGFWILSVLLDYQPLFLAFGFEQTSYHGALIIFSFVSAPVTYFLSPFFSLLSRKHEYEADRYAVDAVGGYQPLSEALLSLSKKSLSNLTPHPWYSFFHYSHPTLHERISAMKRYAEAG